MALDNIILPIHYILSEDATIASKCDFFTIGTPGNTLQDAKLDGTQQTALWIKRPNKTERPYIGTGYEYDLLVQVDILSRLSEAHCYEVADLVETMLKDTRSVSYGGVTYQTNLLLSSRTPMWDNTLDCWDEMIRFHAIGAY